VRPFDAVLFDFRGTLFAIQDDPTWAKCAAARIGRDLSDGEAARLCRHLDDTLAGRPDIAAALERCDTSLEVHRDTLLLWFAAAELDDELAHAIWSQDHEVPETNYPFPDTQPVMRALHEAGILVAVVSDIHYDIRAHFVRHGLDDYVDAYVLSFEHGIQKPDPEVYRRTLTALDVRAERALMVGDRASHDGAAVDVGIATYIFAGPFPAGSTGPRGLDAVLRLVGITPAEGPARADPGGTSSTSETVPR
jgi:HAD superfamily hydrolase (TIGR01509 family)